MEYLVREDRGYMIFTWQEERERLGREGTLTTACEAEGAHRIGPALLGFALSEVTSLSALPGTVFGLVTYLLPSPRCAGKILVLSYILAAVYSCVVKD